MSTARAEKPLPHNLEAERSVLGAVLLDNKALLDVSEILVSEDFFLDQNRRIFVQMLTLHAMDQPIDLVVLTDELHRKGELEAVGGAPYLSALADGMPRVSNVGHYARIVKEQSLLRHLIGSFHAIQEKAFDREESSAILADARARLNKLAEYQPKRGPMAMKEIVNENFENFEKIYKEGRSVTGLATGYTELDKLLAGLQPEELTVLAARPSIGKSSFALNIAENILIRKSSTLPILFFSLEMNRRSLLQRLACSITQTDAHKWRTGHISKEDWRRTLEALGMVSSIPLWIDDSSTITVSEIAARAERLKRDNGLCLVMIDYLQLLSGSRRFSNRQEEVSDISRNLKALAKNLGVPVLALSQLRRSQDREERGPQLSDLRESGAIEQDADVVMFIHRPNFFKAGATLEEREETEIHIAKQRNGPTDMVKFVFRSRFTRFEEAAPDTFFNSEAEDS